MNTPRQARQAGRAGPRPRSAVCPSGRRRSSRSSWTPTRTRARPAGRRLLPLERRLRVHHPAASAAAAACSARGRWSSTRPRRSLPPSSTRATVSSTRCATSSGCSAVAQPQPGEKVLYAGLDRCAGGPHDRELLATASACVRALGRGLPGGADHPTDTDRRGAEGRSAKVRRRTVAEQFSLLMSVYGGDRADYLEAAFRSVVHDQTRPPDDVVLVQDGPSPTRARRDDHRPDPRVTRQDLACSRWTRTSGSGCRSTRGWRPARTTSWPGWTRTTSRCPSASRSRCRSSRKASTWSAPRCWSSVTGPDDIVGQAGAAGRARRDRPIRALPPALQPPDRRLPTLASSRRPAATGTWR